MRFRCRRGAGSMPGMRTLHARAAAVLPRPLRLAAAVAAVLGALAAPSLPAAAAPQVYADVAGLCAGQSPCFLTIQEAVAHAGPAPATVGIFPGLYAESVDLGAMGTAIGGGPGDLTLRALDATGAPASAGVAIDPGAPGGPGSGFAVGVAQVFPGAVSLTGLTLTSPDLAGLALSLTGGAVLDHLVLEGCASLGGGVVTTGNVTATAVHALLNGGVGLVLEGHEVVVTDVVTSGNGGVGLGVLAAGPLELGGVLATLNAGTGIRALSCTALIADTVLAESNAFGAELFVAPDECLAPFPAPSHAAPPLAPRLPASRSEAGQIAAPRALVAGSSHAGSATVTRLTVRDNAGLGAAVGAPAAVVVADALAERNASAGLVLAAEQIRLDVAISNDNGSGVVILGGSARLTQVIANDNAPASPMSPLADGSGILVLLAVSGRAELVDVLAEGNGLAGLVLGAEPQGAVLGPVVVAGSRFADNVVGISSRGDGTVTASFTDVQVVGNTAAGFSLRELQDGLLRRVLVQGNGDGLVATVAGRLDVLESEVAQNGRGLLLALQPAAAAAVSCSNLRGNTVAGLELAVGDAVAARGNFWGAASGPTHPGNPGGTGDAVLDAANGGAGVVDYSGFLAAPATAEACPAMAVTEIPTAGGFGLVLLVALLAACGIAVLRRGLLAG